MPVCDVAALFLKQALCAWRAKRPETCRRKVLECLLDVSRRLEKAAQPDTRPMGRWAHEAAPTPPPPASPPPDMCARVPSRARSQQQVAILVARLG